MFQSSLSTEDQIHPLGVGADVVLENQQEELFQEYSQTKILLPEKKGAGDVGMSSTKSRSLQEKEDFFPVIFTTFALMIESDTKGMFRDSATLKCLFKTCFSEIYHPISFFEGSAPVFLVQHHKLGHDLSLFSHRISPSILFFLFVHS